VRVLTQGEIEADIMRVADEIEEQTHVYADVAHDAAVREADYKLRVARAIVSLSASEARMTAAEKQARADVQAAEELREWKIADARLKATKESLLSLRARMDALRSLSANVRSQT